MAVIFPRPTDVLGYHDYPQRGVYLEMIIEAWRSNACGLLRQEKCCGFPIITMNRTNSLTMAGNHVERPKSKAPISWSRPAHSVT